MKAMRSFSENAPSDETIQRVNTRFLCTDVVVQQLTQPFIRTKNDIGGDGTLSYIQYLAVTSWAFSCLLSPGLYGSFRS